MYNVSYMKKNSQGGKGPLPQNSGPKKQWKIIRYKKPNTWWSQLLNIILTLLIISVLYSFFIDEGNKSEEISLSELAQNIKAGEVKEITVRGEELEILFNPKEGTTEEVTKISKKEVEASLSETLSNYGLTAEELAKANIQIKERTGLGYWL